MKNVKKFFGKFLPLFFMCIAVIAAIVIGFIYFNFVSKRIYDDSTKQLNEIYKVVRRSVTTYIEQKWRILRDWDENITSPNFDFDKRKEEWRYSELYFIRENEAYGSNGPYGQYRFIYTTPEKDWNNASITLDDGRKMHFVNLNDSWKQSKKIINIATDDESEILEFKFDTKQSSELSDEDPTWNWGDAINSKYVGVYVSKSTDGELVHTLTIYENGKMTFDGHKTTLSANFGSTIGGMDLNDAYEELLNNKSIVAGEELNIDGEKQRTTVFAIPVKENSFNGFTFDALAICYTNYNIAYAIDTNPFSGDAKCFVIHSDGRVLFSTEAGGGVQADYIKRLQGLADNKSVDEAVIEQLKSDWASQKTNTIQCEINGNDHCIVYQPLGYQDFIMLSEVPLSTISSGFLYVQRLTTIVFVIIFLLVGVTAFTALLIRNRRQSQTAKAEIAYREKMFDILSATVDDIFIMLDHTTQEVDYLSPNVERLLGISDNEIKKDIRTMAKCAVNYDIIIPKEVLGEIAPGANKYWECEYMHQLTGERRWYRVTIYNINIQNTQKYLIVMSDRTLEQQMNQKLQEALDAAKSANEAKSNFLSNMSHDIRTPMNAIVGFSVLLEKDADNTEKVREYTRKIMASSHHLLSLINDVLDMSKIESGKTSLNVDRFSLPELLEELNIIILPQAKAKKQDFIIKVKNNPPDLIMGDKLRLNQILLNLLSNAIKYTPIEGKIEFIISEIDRSAPQYVKLRFTVRDNGIGMSEEFVKEVFAPFSREINSVTNKIQGTGLGMAITKNLVDLMGGIITVDSELGKGSTFTVELSFALPEQGEADNWYNQKIKRMLVADDEEDICLNIKEMMRDTGVDVSYVTNGADAVERAVHAHEHDDDFNVILLDWKMPGMDGVETARRIRDKIGNNVPILVLTSYDWSDIEDEARAAGINAFMPKPFFTSTFWQTIKPLFEEITENAEHESSEITESPLKDLFILIAEDNELNAEILTEMLDIEGAKCELAVNGKEAYDKFVQSEPGHYDMILMDVQMPIMNGYEATEKIRASSHPQAKTIPIVAMTANTFAEDVRNALNAGMDGHLAKPIDMTKVRELIRKILNKNKEN